MDVLVIGSGIAGSTAALRLSARHRVTLVTKDELGDSNTEWAQGGIAGVLFPDDSVESHIADTMVAGAWLNDAEAVRVLCTDGPDRILELASLGVEFDRAHETPSLDSEEASDPAVSSGTAPELLRRGGPSSPGPLTWARGLEGAHSVPRIYHAGGDATGKAIVAALTRAVRARAAGISGAASAAERAGTTRAGSLTIREHTMLLDLVQAGEHGRVVGARLLASPPANADPDVPTGTSGAASDSATGDATAAIETVRADVVVLATGGAGQLYAHTTNPAAATGDGLAAAMRAGAEVADLEFFQFHPTALAGSGFLLSEALRGAGAILLDATGHRFMPEVHPLAELAPRDVVALAIHRRMAAQGGAPCLLDATGVPDVIGLFPTIARGVAMHGFDLSAEPIPVTPAAHYYMGGVVTDLDGRTSLDGLFAIGEVARTGVHGANRLASNSLLEGAVFAVRAADAIDAESTGDAESAVDSTSVSAESSSVPRSGDARIDRARLKALAWDRLGIERDAVGLHRALDDLDVMTAAATSAADSDTAAASLRESAETANLALIAAGIARAALAREESVGAHTRTDFPARTSPALAFSSRTARTGTPGAPATDGRASDPRTFELQEA